MIAAILNHPYLWWVFYLFIFALLTGLIKLSIKLGHQRFNSLDKTQKTQAESAAKAMLGLTGFLLAICFGIAEDKFSLRRSMVLQEANAVSTTFLRSYLLPEEYQERTQNLLRGYSTMRHKAVLEKKFLEGKIKSEAIQKELWKIAVKAGNKEPRSLGIRLFTESLNGMIDLMEERWTAGIYYNLPKTMGFALIISTFLSIGLLAFSYGAKGSTKLWIPLLPGLLFAVIAILIVDLSNTRQHFFEVPQDPIVDTIKMMKTWK